MGVKTSSAAVVTMFCLIVMGSMVPAGATAAEMEILNANIALDLTKRHSWFPHVEYNPIDNEYLAADLLSDLLGRGKSSRLFEELVKKQKLFTSISAHVLGTIDPGLLIIQGRLLDNVSFEMAEKSIWAEIDKILNFSIDEKELEKVKNQANKKYG